VGEYRNIKITNLERNNPQETPCTLPQDKQEERCAADIAIDDAKENAWMALYEHDSDTLEDILYHRLQDLWAPLTDAMKVFYTHGSAQQLCAQKVWEALLTAFPHSTAPWATLVTYPAKTF
jgi:hypothetical protein